MSAHHNGPASVAQSCGLPEVPSLHIPEKEPRAECVAGAQDILNRHLKPRYIFSSDSS